MPRKKPSEPTSDVFDQAIAGQQEAREIVKQVADSTKLPEEKPSAVPAVVPVKGQNEPAYTGIVEVLPDGTKANYRHYGNRDGVAVTIDYKDEKEVPPKEVTEPLKEDHPGRERFRWKNKEWHKHVRQNPVAECLDAEERFAAMTERLKADRAKKAQQEPAR
jgi:hypothetical protein